MIKSVTKAMILKDKSFIIWVSSDLYNNLQFSVYFDEENRKVDVILISKIEKPLIKEDIENELKETLTTQYIDVFSDAGLNK